MEWLEQPGRIQLVVICAYLGLLLILGYWASRGSKGTREDYLLASHSIGPFLLLMSIFGTTMTAFALVGSSGEAYKEGIGVYGMLASSSGIVHSLCFFLLGIKLWSFGKRYGYTTQIEFFRDRLDSELIGIVLFPVLVGLVIPYLLIGVMAGGTVVQTMTAGAFPNLFPSDLPAMNGGVPSWLGSLVICGVVLVYVFFGGMRGTAWANTFQTLVFMVLGVVTFVVLADRLSGVAVEQMNAQAVAGEAIEKPESLLGQLQLLSARAPADKVTRSEMSKTRFFSYLLIPLSVGMFPHLFQHWLTAKSAKTFRLPVVCHPVFIMIVWVPCVLIGVWASTFQLPPAIQGDPSAVPPIPANPNAVLPFVVKKFTTPNLAGLLTAGILAAIMSSLDSQFLCLGTIFSNDIAAHYLGRDRLTEERKLMLARVFIIVIVAITYVLSQLELRSVFTLGVWCFSGFASLTPLAFLALYWRRLTAWGGIAGVLAMIATWFYLFARSDFGENTHYSVDLVWGGNTYQMMPVVTIFFVSLVTTVVVSLLTKPPREEVLRKFF